MNAKKIVLLVAVAIVALLGVGVAYAQTTTPDDADENFKGSITASEQSGASLQEQAKVDEAAARQAALDAVPGTAHEIELETSDNGFLVYEVEVAGEDGNNHEVKVDAGNGEILHQNLEEEQDESDDSD